MMVRAALAQRREKLFPAVLGFLGVLFSFSLYQPFAMFIVPFVLLELFEQRHHKEAFLKVLFHAAAITLLALVVYYSLVVVRLPLWLDAPQEARGTFTRAPLLKFVWFFAMPLRDVLNLFVVFRSDAVVDVGLFDADAMRAGGVIAKAMKALAHPAYLLSTVVGVCTLFSLHRISRTSFSRPMLWGIGVIALPASYALNIVVDSYWSPFRTQVALYGVVIVILLLGIQSLGVSNKNRIIFLRIVIMSSTLAAILTAHFYVSKPLRDEWQDAQVQAAKLLQVPKESVRVFPARLEDHYGPRPRYEMGRAASTAPWGERALASCAFKELGAKRKIVIAQSIEDADMVLGRK